jgi:hypothetical protein
MKPIFEATENGLEIVDRIERHRYHLTTHTPTSIESVDCDRIPYPVDAAVEIATDSITLPTNIHVYIRGSDKSLISEVKPSEQAFFSDDEYILDLSGPMKVYVSVESSLQVYSDTKRTHVNFGDISTATIGARSYHTRPATTITTTTNPSDWMEAVSLFSSALKTITPDRSYPTLRGHPPSIEVGNQVNYPDEIERPDTGIEIEIPSTIQNVIAVAPLAYYLGAKLVPGSNIRLTTGTGYSHELSNKEEIGQFVKKTLKQVFFLDCIVRAGGITPISVHNQNKVESVVNFDVSAVYNHSLGKQVEKYLEVPFSDLDPYVPEWRLETQLDPTTGAIEFLPYITNSLSLVNTQKNRSDLQQSAPIQTEVISEFTRDGRDDFTRRRHLIRNGESGPDPVAPSSTVRQIWGSQDGSEIISTTPLAAFQNSARRNPREDPIDIKVVCNDSSMREEFDNANGAYGNRDELPFSIGLYYDLTTADLEDLLTSDSDFLHYIGHIDVDGFQCSDGKLNASVLEESNVKAFLLNACQSRNQGLHLVEAGSIGGIVTLGEVVNSGAIRIGHTIAQLLNQGFPLYGALDIARNESVIGQQYIIVGDGMTTIAQTETDVPNVCISNKDGQQYLTRIKTYDSIEAQRGSVFTPYLDSVDDYYLVPDTTNEMLVEGEKFQRFLEQGRFPVLLDGSVCWSDEILGQKGSYGPM